jgi:hypothetical protein
MGSHTDNIKAFNTSLWGNDFPIPDQGGIYTKGGTQKPKVKPGRGAPGAKHDFASASQSGANKPRTIEEGNTYEAKYSKSGSLTESKEFEDILNGNDHPYKALKEAFDRVESEKKTHSRDHLREMSFPELGVDDPEEDIPEEEFPELMGDEGGHSDWTPDEDEDIPGELPDDFQFDDDSYALEDDEFVDDEDWDDEDVELPDDDPDDDDWDDDSWDEDGSGDGFDTEEYDLEDEPDWDDGPSMSDDLEADEDFPEGLDDDFGDDFGDE